MVYTVKELKIIAKELRNLQKEEEKVKEQKQLEKEQKKENVRRNKEHDEYLKFKKERITEFYSELYFLILQYEQETGVIDWCDNIGVEEILDQDLLRTCYLVDNDTFQYVIGKINKLKEI